MHADVLVIGFGKGGKTVAKAMLKRGKRVVMVEQSDRMYGGTCPNVGCVPSKALVHHANGRRPEDSAPEYYERAVGRVQEIREHMRLGQLASIDGVEGGTVITGKAKFVDPHTVAIDDQVTIGADTILINTGSEPVVPPIPGLRESPRLLLSTELLESRALPGRLAILGGGFLGIEFASIYQRFGAQVTVLEAAPRILMSEDDDVAETARRILEAGGMEIRTGVRVREVRDGTVVLDDGTVEADAILAATGRAPATRGLGLEAAGVQTNERGAVVVDEHLRTSQPHIFALGDVNGGPQFTYISLDDSRIVLDQLAGDGRRRTTDRVAIPRTLFMTPPLATVGLTEREAREAGHRIKVGSEAVADIVAAPRFYAVEETRGMMKFVIDAETDAILGAALLSADAQELINTVALAMRHGITAAQLSDEVYTHPSSTEAFNEVIGAIVRADDPRPVAV